jgi:class 3 adenylate cyclase
MNRCPPTSELTPDDQPLLVTLLSIDIVGSTELVDAVGDWGWSDRLDGFFDLFHGSVESGGGVCVDHDGDGALAAFRSPSSAVTTALELCWDAPRRLDFDVRAGVHTGEVLFRHGRISGLAVHVASRIQDQARARQTLVSEPTAQLISWPIDFTSIGAVHLRGLDAAVELLEAEPWQPGDDGRVLGAARCWRGTAHPQRADAMASLDVGPSAEHEPAVGVSSSSGA